MKMIDVLLKLNDIKNKLSKNGHPANKIVITNDSGIIETTENITINELEKLEGVRDNIQTQIDSKLNKEGFLADKILITDETGAIKESNLDKNKLDYLLDLDGSVQTQINNIKDNIDLVETELEEAELQINKNTQDITINAQNIALNKQQIDNVGTDLEGEKLKITALSNDLEAEKLKITKNTNDIAQNTNKIVEMEEDIRELAQSGGDTGAMFEIQEAKAPFSTLKEKLSDMDKKAIVDDILLGIYELGKNRALILYGEESEIIATISKDKSHFNKLEVGELYCNNVITKQKGINLYVDGISGSDNNNGLSEGTAFKTITKAINSLNKYLITDVNIYVTETTYTEELLFEGFCGLGALTLNLKTATINGDILINSCATTVRVVGTSTSAPATLNHTSDNISACRVHTSPYAYIQYLKIIGNTNTKYGVEVHQGGGAAIKNNIINNTTTSAIVAFECSRAYVIGCKGSNNAQYSIYSASGSTICISTAIPDAPKENWNTTGIIHGTATKTTVETLINEETISE